MDVPPNRPLITPELLPITATVVLLLIQVPPVTELLKVTVNPWHTDNGPEIAAGVGLTVNVIMAMQP